MAAAQWLVPLIAVVVLAAAGAQPAAAGTELTFEMGPHDEVHFAPPVK